MYKRARLVVLASGVGSNLQAILDNIINQNLNAKVHAVISDNKHAPALDIARRHGIPTHIVKGGFGTIDYCRPYMPDLIICAGYMRIINKKSVEEYEGRILNIHPSLLPMYKGNNAIWQAWKAGASPVGCTVHLVTPDVGAGEIRGQYEIDNNLTDNLTKLTRKVKEAEHKLYWRTIQTYWYKLQEENSNARDCRS